MRAQTSPRKRRSRNEGKTADKNGGIQIQIDPLRLVIATLVLAAAILGVWWIGRNLSDTANPETPAAKKTLTPESRPSAPVIKPTP